MQMWRDSPGFSRAACRRGPERRGCPAAGTRPAQPPPLELPHAPPGHGVAAQPLPLSPERELRRENSVGGSV